jgi:uncharacterized protein YjbJ (UPF0337 family)
VKEAEEEVKHGVRDRRYFGGHYPGHRDLAATLDLRSVGRSGSGAEQRKEDTVGRKKSSRQDKNEGAMDKAKGRAKEAAGAVTGDETRKSEGRADQRSGTAKEKKGKLKDLFK